MSKLRKTKTTAKTDGRSFHYIDPEVLALFKQILQAYGTRGTKEIFQAIINGKVKIKI